MKLVIMALFAFSVSTAFAGGPSMIKKAYECSNQGTYNVYIEKTSGITNSYRVMAFCQASKDESFEACFADESEEAFVCYNEFRELNPLKSGDGALVIVNGR